jgi:hypothetical protein
MGGSIRGINIVWCDTMKNTKDHHTVRTVPKSNRNIVETKGK